MRLTFTFLTLFVVFFSLEGQENDFQTWTTVKANFLFTRNLRFHIEEELRMQENSALFGRQINNIGLSYRWGDYIKTAVFYRLEADWKNADNYVWRNGIYGDLSLEKVFGRFDMGYRLRFQSVKIEKNADDAGQMFSGYKHRHKLSLDYNIKSFPVDPFMEFEVFITGGKGNEGGVSCYRTWLGLEYTLRKVHSFALKYGIDKEVNEVNPVCAYILGIEYAVNLRFYKPKE